VGRRSRQERSREEICFMMLSFCNLTIFLPFLRKQNYNRMKAYTIRLEKEERFLDKEGLSIDESLT
jgi:hypothetical protein